MRSKFERRVAAELTTLGVKYEYETYVFTYASPIQGSCVSCGGTNLFTFKSYTPDFYLPSQDRIIETKGKWTADDRKKMRLVIEQFPDEKWCMLFMRDNKIHRNSNTRYSDYCTKYGIEFAIYEKEGVPNKWLTKQ